MPYNEFYDLLSLLHKQIMTTLNAEIYDALIAIKVPEDKARAAAAAIPSQENFVSKTEFNAQKTAFNNLKKDVQWIRDRVNRMYYTLNAVGVGIAILLIGEYVLPWLERLVS